MTDDTTFIRLSLLFQYQGSLKPVDTLGIVVAVDEHDLQITDWSRRNLTPFRVKRNAPSLKSQGKVSKPRNIQTEHVIKEGDCLVLRRFFVRFDLKREGLPYLQMGSDCERQSGTCCIWKSGNDRCIECNRTLSAFEVSRMRELYSWWCSKH